MVGENARGFVDENHFIVCLVKILAKQECQALRAN